jgi:hypothetical protein
MAKVHEKADEGSHVTVGLTEPEAYLIVSALGMFVANVLGPGLVNAIQRQEVEAEADYSRLSKIAVGLADQLRPAVVDGPTDRLIQGKVEARRKRIVAPGKLIVAPGEGE